ncbi:MAG TPA: PaaI family thioesterase [Clostridiales bacterium]|nr:PaaI family thioesterase [Clostridiales bacterium]
MKKDPKFDKLVEFFKGDTFAVCNNIKIVEANENYAICKAAISEDSLNGDGVIQGGLIYTLADFAFAIFANYIAPITLTQVGNISYVKAGHKDNRYIFAKATLIDKTERNIFCKVLVTDEWDNIIAIANFNGFIKK